MVAWGTYFCLFYETKDECTASTSTIDRLFDAFYTTKADGMASRDFGQGATFQFILPLLPGA
jgi:hypothetical protein